MSLPEGLEYASGEGPSWHAVPSWTTFYAVVGRLAARGVAGNSRLVLALSVPDRYMVAPMLGVGAILGVVERELVGVTPQQRFAQLAELPSDAVLRFTSPLGDVSRLGTFGGTTVREGVEYIKINSYVGKGKPCTFLEPVQWAMNIQRTELTPDEIPRSGRGRKAGASSHRFWGRFLPDSDFEAFNRDAKVECLLLGNGPQLQQEIRDQALRVPRDSSQFSLGTLDNLLRVRAYSSVGAPSWSEVVSTAGARRLSERHKMSPRVVVFDGARGFLRWRKYYGDSAWIVVLDRTDSQFGDGVDELNAAMALGSEPETALCIGDELPSGVTIPPGVEVSGFFRFQTG